MPPHTRHRPQSRTRGSGAGALEQRNSLAQVLMAARQSHWHVWASTPGSWTCTAPSASCSRWWRSSTCTTARALFAYGARPEDTLRLLSKSGTRQGDPLRPLLFAIAIHAALLRVQEKYCTRGIDTLGMCVRVSSGRSSRTCCSPSLRRCVLRRCCELLRTAA